MPNISIRMAGPLLAALVVLGGCEKPTPSVQKKQSPLGEIANGRSSPRRVYPYSLIPGGVFTESEFQAYRKTDPQLANHYRDIGPNVRPAALPIDRLMYSSYRVENAIYWTKKPLLIHAGETVLTDGANSVRGRCGNRLSVTPRTPVRKTEPPDVGTDIPLAPQTPLVQIPQGPVIPVIPGAGFPGEGVPIPGPPLVAAPPVAGPIVPAGLPPGTTPVVVVPPAGSPAPGPSSPAPILLPGPSTPTGIPPVPIAPQPVPLPVPETPTWTLFILGLALIGLFLWVRKIRSRRTRAGSLSL